jgi:hypothetical protein
MKKKMMLLVASVLCSFGITLMVLTLMLVMSGIVFAQTTESNPPKSCTGSCIFSNGACRNVDCSGTNCGCAGGRSDCSCQ